MKFNRSVLAGGLCLSLVAALQPGLAYAAYQGQQLHFVDTRNGEPIRIEPDSRQAEMFVTTGQNPYISDPQAISQGQKLYQLYSCGQCHGSQAQGQTAKGLTGPQFNYAKTATDKGMFEIIYAGTNGGMSPKGRGLMDPANPQNGLSPDEILKVIAWIRSQGEPVE
ncbi:MAG TPA: c-type cytochrome [Methylophilaceae bacterium]|nr:c-type cytochrome [Methylophilaceae bacterium]